MRIPTILAFLILITSCKKSNKQLAPSQFDQNIISSFSAQELKVKEPFFIRFSKNLIADELVGQEVSNELWSVSPKTKTKAVWLNLRTIVLTPVEQWEFDQGYKISLNLNTIDPKFTEVNSFNFVTRPAHAELSVGQLEIKDQANYKIMQLSGRINTSDVIAAEVIEKAIEIKQENNKELKISWTHQEDKSIHRFVIDNIIRQAEGNKLTIKTKNIAPLVDFNKTKQIKVPAVKLFSLLDIPDLSASADYIDLNFTDPLDENQNLTGLVRFKEFESKLSFDIEGNKLKIYASPFPDKNVELILDKSIKNGKGENLEKDKNVLLTLIPEKPQVRFVTPGNILPKEEKSVLAFEAKALKSVRVEIFKINQDNVLQFLQYNKLNSASQDRRVGKIVHHEKIELAKLGETRNLNKWERYAINLDPLVMNEPGAIYQVRLGFQKEDVSYICDTEYPKILNSNGKTYKSILDNNWKYEGAEYSHYENPCYPAYYSSRHFISRNVLVSNIALIAKKSSTGKLYVHATDIKTAKPISGVRISFYNYQKQLLLKSTTDHNGACYIQNLEQVFFAIATDGSQYSYLAMTYDRDLPYNHFDIAGTKKQSGLQAFIYGERGVWRPGDTLHLSVMVEDKNKTLPSDHPVKLKLYNAKGDLHSEKISSNHIDRLYVFKMTTSPNDPTGKWRAQIEIGNSVYSKNLKVETIKPNRLKIKLSSRNDTLKKTDKLSIESKWLHGAAAANLKSRIEGKFQTIKPKFKNYSGYKFIDPARKYKTITKVIFDKELDENGENDFMVKLAQSDLYPGNLKVDLSTRVFEKGGNFSENFDSRILLPYDNYVGLKMPKTKWGRSYIGNNPTPIEIVSLDDEGQPNANRKLKIGLYESRWSWWYNRADRNLYKYNSDKHYGAFDTLTVTTDAHGKAQYKSKLGDKYGSYLIRICDQESGHCTGNFFYTGRWGGNSENDKKVVSKLDITTNESKYKVGDQVTLEFPSSPAAKILVSIESAEGVLQSEWIDSQGELTKYSFKANEDMTPNIYLSVTMLQPWSRENDLPIRMYGILPITIMDEKTYLHPEINTANEFSPNSTATIEVTEKDGKEMAYTIAMVDEGLLDLTNYKTPNPHAHFFAKQAYQMTNWDVYDNIMNKMGVSLEKLISIGGDGSDNLTENKANVSRFKPVLFFDGPFKLEKGETKKHTIKIPNYRGSVKFMVVARNENAYGNANRSVPVKQDLMVLSTLPRVLSPGEELSVPVNAFWSKDRKAKVSINLETNNLLEVKTKNANLQFNRAGDQIAYLSTLIGSHEGEAKLKIEANHNTLNSYDETSIEIRNPNPILTVSKDTFLKPGEELSQVINRFGVAGNQSAFIEISGLPSIHIEDRMQYLISYPYGCLEQTVSTALAQLGLPKIMDLSTERKLQIDNNIVYSLNKLKAYQTSRGNFVYWPGSPRYYDTWADIYAGYFIYRAKDSGYYVSDNMLEKWKKYQKNLAAKFKINLQRPYEQEWQAYRLFVLSLYGKEDLGAMNRLRNAAKLSSLARYLLAAAYGSIGQNEVGIQILEDTEEIKEDTKNAYYSFGSTIRNQAIASLAYAQLDNKSSSLKVVKNIVDQLNRGKWFSTHSLAFSLTAISDFYQEMNDQIKFDLQINQGKTHSVSSQRMLNVYDLNLEEKSNFTVRNTSENIFYVNVINKGKELPKIYEAKNENLQIQIKYLDNDRKEIDISKLKQGTDFYAQVTVKNPGTARTEINDLALAQIFPSGWEIISGRLSNTDDTKRSTYEFEEFKDDRVHTFFGLKWRKSKTFEVKLSATYPGRFYYPPSICESMYDNSIYAITASKWVEVIQD